MEILTDLFMCAHPADNMISNCQKKAFSRVTDRECLC